ncbi:HDOD domain-containing protein [Luteimonas deserti]|uniref:HDOD domain-containing protein n=1 Tax=Luteimonas deserti TaxID=2752306 RepID=A0A7Z0QQG7_9GAMM|nr:HDOD domain-containing protein [Luteimonas deserti]NYZ61952.1 HDOD domain-containing protein [Luteimonas deserti]
MRILFVDDEERVLAGIRRTLFMADRDWETDFATSGADALVKLVAQPADVVVSDMRMPMMDGGQLLRRVRDAWPATVRIILSGHTEQEAALRTLDVAHRFLAKPCDGDALIEAIDRTMGLQELLQHKALQEVVGRIGTLPAAPHMYERLTRLLAEEGERVAQVVATVEQDPALAAKVLQLANCAFFNEGELVADIAEAVARVGLPTLRTLVLATEVFGRKECAEVDALRLQAVHASRLAGEIADAYAPRETTTTAALLAEVGKLLPEVEHLCGEADARGDGFPTHAEIGAYLLGMWGLPATIVEAVAHHRNPERVQPKAFDALGVVHVAVALARGESPDKGYLDRMGVAERLQQWGRTCAAQVPGK